MIYLPPPTPPWRVDELGTAILKATACLASICIFALACALLALR